MQRMNLMSTPKDDAAPDITKVYGPGWYQTLNGDICMNVDKCLVVLREVPGVDYCCVKLLAPDNSKDLWVTTWEMQCKTHGQLLEMAQRMIQQGRIDSAAL